MGQDRSCLCLARVFPSELIRQPPSLVSWKTLWLVRRAAEQKENETASSHIWKQTEGQQLCLSVTEDLLEGASGRAPGKREQGSTVRGVC